MHPKGHLVAVVGLGVAFSAGLLGQSIIEYGHGVGRAGAAGAASGTGIAGIFSKVRDTSEDDKTKKRSTTGVQTREQTTEAYERDASEPGNAPLKMKTSSGAVVSGVSPSWMGAAYRDPLSEPIRVKKVEWSNPEENAAENKTAEQQVELAGSELTSTGEVVAEASAEAATSETRGAAHVVSPGHSHGESSVEGSVEPGFGAPPQLEAVTDAEIAGVRIGSRIDEVIRTLGRPTFAFTGLTGRSYTEKYVFKNADGETITVLTWAGVVTSVLVS